jgi:hypothetical protein
MKWEYKIERVSMGWSARDVGLTEGILNELGGEGWEAVAWWHTLDGRVDENNHDTLVLLKRPIDGG